MNFTAIRRRTSHLHTCPPVPPTPHRRVDHSSALPIYTYNEVVDAHHPAPPQPPRSAIAYALRFGARDIARRRTIAGKATFGCLVLLVIRCACSAPRPAPSSASTAVERLPTRTPSPIARPAATATPVGAAVPADQALATAAPAQPTATDAPSPPAGTPAPPASDDPARPAGLPSAVAARVIDGDTPETVDPRTPVASGRIRISACFGREASARADG